MYAKLCFAKLCIILFIFSIKFLPFGDSLFKHKDIKNFMVYLFPNIQTRLASISVDIQTFGNPQPINFLAHDFVWSTLLHGNYDYVWSTLFSTFFVTCQNNINLILLLIVTTTSFNMAKYKVYIPIIL